MESGLPLPPLSLMRGRREKEFCSGEESGLVVDVWRHSSEVIKKSYLMKFSFTCYFIAVNQHETNSDPKGENAVAAVENEVPYFKRDVGRYLLSDDALGSSAYQTSLSLHLQNSCIWSMVGNDE